MKFTVGFKIFITIIATIILVFLAVFVNKKYLSETDGIIYINIVDEEINLDKTDEVSFSKGEKLVDILKRNYVIDIKDGFLYQIDEIKSYDISNKFIQIWLNDKLANKGIEQLAFKNKDKITFKLAKVGDY